MKALKVTVASSALALAIVFAMPSVASATITNNRGAVIKVSGSCSEIQQAIKNNRGSVIKVTGDGTCDISKITENGTIENNRGTVIKVSGVCGTVPQQKIENNRGTVIKISSNGDCVEAVAETKTPEVKGASDVKPAATNEAKAAVPTVLPNTGSGSVVAGAVTVATVLGTVASVVRRRFF